MKASVHNSKKGFTIVELIVVIVVIGILSAIGIVGYGAWQQNLAEASTKSDLLNAVATIEDAANFNNEYPEEVSFSSSVGVTVTGGSDGQGGYCITAQSTDFITIRFYQDHLMSEPAQGLCPNDGWSWLSVANDFSCGIYREKPYCWGQNSNNKLGDGTTTASATPVPVNISGELANKKITRISAGNTHACAIADKRVYCWGSNGSGQFGNGTTTPSATPTPVNWNGILAGKEATEVAALANSTCVLASGGVYCWGTNFSGVLGTGVTSYDPALITLTSGLTSSNVTHMSDGYGYSMCVTADGNPFCWGGNNTGTQGNNVATGNTLAAVPSILTGVINPGTVSNIDSYQVSCAQSEGRAYCWGYNVAGSVGNGTTTEVLVPTPVSTTVGDMGTRTVTDIAVNGSASCAIAEGRAYCWGSGGSGAIGDGSYSTRTTPRGVSTSGVLSNVTLDAIDGGPAAFCAISIDRNMDCWGSGGSGKLGNGAYVTQPSPVQVVNPTL